LKHNETKIMVLDILNKSTKGLKAREINNKMNPKNSMFSLMRCLKKYYSFGLISRKKINNFFVYFIKENGIERLNYLMSEMVVEIER